MAEDDALRTSAVPAGRIVVWPGFPAIIRQASVDCSSGTSSGIPFHHLPVTPPDKFFGPSPTFNHTSENDSSLSSFAPANLSGALKIGVMVY
jgi:hypothetical protein